eukprot:SAG31_NODE_5533_length_2471_cov_1.929595_3_plen_36_part_01
MRHGSWRHAMGIATELLHFTANEAVSWDIGTFWDVP